MNGSEQTPKLDKGSRKGRKDPLCLPTRIPLRPLRLNVFAKRWFIFVVLFGCSIEGVFTAAQTRPRKRAPKPVASQQQAPRGSAVRYAAFLHSSVKHQGLTCNACHKVPTEWTAKRTFPDVADFPNHDACVRCHRQQFFTRQAFSDTGPAICTVCHVRAAPREDGRFAFGKPNNANQAMKASDQRQFTIEFPHDKHQNVIASQRSRRQPEVRIYRAAFGRPSGDKPEYNNCSVCHQRNDLLVITPLSPQPEAAAQSNKFFKTMPRSHDSCFNCHWRNQKPTGDDCGGCHKPSATFVKMLAPKRISAMFSHEGGQGNHVQECTTCHINITRRSTLVGLFPDVPITICATCHTNNKKITYSKITTIEDEFEQYKKTARCTYCHVEDVGKKKPPASHEAAAQ